MLLQVVDLATMSTDSEPELQDWELVRIMPEAVARAWHRFVTNRLTVARLSGLFGHLGNYLKVVKQRGVAVSMPAVVATTVVSMPADVSWQLIVTNMLTVAILRRSWANIGSHLNAIKTRGVKEATAWRQLHDLN